MNTNIREDEMSDGYLDGLHDSRLSLPKDNNYSPAYIYGWENGRDDRMNKPRELAAVLRARAEMIIGTPI